MATPEAVKKLREQTGAGILDCSKALKEANDDLEKAIELLRKKGLASALKKAGRAANEGSIGSYIHMGAKLGVMVEVNCETDFVARTDAFQALVKNLAMHVAAANPQYISRDQVSAAVVEKEKEILRAQLKDSGKPEQIIEKIVEGRLDKFYGEQCLLEQAFVKDPDKTIEQYVKNTIATLGENILVKRFVRWQLGETNQE